jgi:hypothetical protein
MFESLIHHQSHQIRSPAPLLWVTRPLHPQLDNSRKMLYEISPKRAIFYDSKAYVHGFINRIPSIAIFLGSGLIGPKAVN